jgi:hypothetical protein
MTRVDRKAPVERCGAFALQAVVLPENGIYIDRRFDMGPIGDGLHTIKTAGLYIVVFGSAALAATGHNVTPNDIDIIYGGVPNSPEVCEHVTSLVWEWAGKHDLPESLPLDIHYYGNDDDPIVPRPFDSDAPTVIVHGFCNVRYRSYRGFASAIRAFGHDADRLVDVLTLGPESGSMVWEISLRASHGFSDNWQEDYCDGVEAILSALRHTAPGVWETAVKVLPWLSFVDALVRRGADLDGIGYAAVRSSGGGARVFVGSDGIRTQYQHNAGEMFTIEEGIQKFVAPPVLLMNTTIVTAPGQYELSEPISAAQAREMVKIGTVSTIGHDAAARAMSAIMEIDVPMNRVPSVQRKGQKAICLKIRGRLPEGMLLDDAALREVGFDLFVLTRIA